MKLIILYLVLINLYGIYIMYIDKRRARQKKWRISENYIFLVALFLGSIGIIIGMKAFRHKTKHFKFIFGIPAILLIQLCLTYYYFYKW